MNQESIIVDISPSGNVRIEANGFTGAACEKATEQLELVLGGGTTRKSKPERHMPPASNAQHNKLPL